MVLLANGGILDELSWSNPVIRFFVTLACIISIPAGLFAFTTWVERKVLARIANRLGPNRVGPFGLFQPVADGLKMLTKEDIVPARADKAVHTLAPILALVPAFLGLVVLPVGKGMIPADLNIGLLYFFAVGSMSEVAVFMAGWSSHNKYSLLGGIRAIAQMIAYEIPLILSSLTVVMIAGSMSTVDIVRAQRLEYIVNPEWHGLLGLMKSFSVGWLNSIGGWYVWTPWGFVGFIIFFISLTAELNRAPFDLPEAESEIIAGHHTEYSGFKFALFFLGEYISMFAICGIATTLFLGGWNGPFASKLGWLWFLLKAYGLVLILMWVRGTFPRLRIDQLMRFAWVFLLPLALVDILAAGLWFHLPWIRVGHLGELPILGWIVSAGLLWWAYAVLGKRVQHKAYEKRVYRFAT
ncbi:MAG: NADH-quinone oxidoreductase subunit H [Verrucomicrobiae bacterium]|nr:NADH-quinone oxidoreductase subunit H [Verrucomicrobiae bacterium]